VTRIVDGLSTESRTRETRDINGCLEFGNHHAPMKEYFIGHVKDVPLADAEGDCRRRPTAGQPPGKGAGMLEPIKSLLELFVASNADNAEMTLVHVSIDAELSRVETATYRNVLRFSFLPAVKDFTGNINDITMRSRSSVLQRALTKPGQEAQVARLSDRRDQPVTFETKQSGDVEIDNAELGFFDVKGRFVGSVFVPVVAAQ
jgi:hypothetical protein